MNKAAPINKMMRSTLACRILRELGFSDRSSRSSSSLWIGKPSSQPSGLPFDLENMSTIMPTMTAKTNKTPISSKVCLGIMASMTKASSPDDAIIMATNAPKLSNLWEYIETAAKPPMQPGMRPNPAPKTTCPAGCWRSRENHFPCELRLTNSSNSIMIVTKPVIKTLFLSTSTNKWRKSCMTCFLNCKDNNFLFLHRNTTL